MSKSHSKWLELIAKKGSLTNHDAVVNYILSPTKVISDLRRQGYKITHIREKSKNSWFYRYFLEEVA